MGKVDFDFDFISSSVDVFFTDEKTPKVHRASTGKTRISSARDLIGFTRVSSNTLVHVSQKDFWRIGKDDEGHYIERLVSDDTGPVVEE